MKVLMTAIGTRPIMFHNVRLASPMDPIAKAIKQITSKRTKTDEDRLEIARLEFEGGLYHDDVLGPYMPGIYMFRSLLNAARITRDGKKVERGLVVGSFQMPLVYKGPRDVEGLWGNGESKYVDMRTVVVNRQKVDRCRPIFDEWTVECEMTIDPSILDPEDLVRIAPGSGGPGPHRGERRGPGGRRGLSADVRPVCPYAYDGRGAEAAQALIFVAFVLHKEREVDYGLRG